MRIEWLSLRKCSAKIILGAMLVVAVPVQAALAEVEKRVALVIGNSAYKSVVPLENPVTDAKAVSAALKRLGFEVIEGYDLGTLEMRNTLAQFSSALPESKAAMVYYAGHGVSVEDENFLIPTDLTLHSQTDLDLNAVSLSLVLKQMRREDRVNVVILDACRDNPFTTELQRGARNRSAVAERGLSRIDTDLAKGTLIAFATDPRSTALDGKPGDNSPFTKALLRHMEEPGISIDAVMNRVRADVWEETRQRQMPWVNTSIIGEFILNPVAAPRQQVAALTDVGASPIANPASERLAQENKMWDSAERGNSSDDYRAYLEAYPNGVYSAMAKSRIARLSGSATAAVNPSTATAATTVAAVAAAPAPAMEATRSKSQVNPALKAEQANQQTEKLMKLNLQARKEVQQRLIALGYDAGEPNGTFTPKTRDAIGEWQAKNELQSTKYLGPLQRQAVLDQSEEAWKRISMLRPDPAPATRKLTPTREKPVRTVRTRVRSEDAPAPQRARQPAGQPGLDGVGAFIGGMALGGALHGILRH